MSAWILPDHIADVLPREALHIERLRRDLLNTARSYGFELVIPPLLEHLSSLLSGAGQALDLKTFKLVDQMSGRMMGLRADTTPQVARMDAHLLNRPGVTRLCYCGPVLHTSPGSPHATREPLQLGAEVYGHTGLLADLEVLTLATDCLRVAHVPSFCVDLADARLVKALLAGVPLSAERTAALHQALASKDRAELLALTRHLPASVRQGLLVLVEMYGDAQVLREAQKFLPGLIDRIDRIDVHEVLQDLNQVVNHLQSIKVHRDIDMDMDVSIDLADLHGYAYYTGVSFAVYVPGVCDALVRGGRYDEVGAVFGRSRPAAGFSLDLKSLVGVTPPPPVPTAICAPWSEDVALNAAIAALRASGQVVVCVPSGQAGDVDGFDCKHTLLKVDGQWVVS